MTSKVVTCKTTTSRSTQALTSLSMYWHPVRSTRPSWTTHSLDSMNQSKSTLLNLVTWTIFVYTRPTTLSARSHLHRWISIQLAWPTLCPSTIMTKPSTGPTFRARPCTQIHRSRTTLRLTMVWRKTIFGPSGWLLSTRSTWTTLIPGAYFLLSNKVMHLSGHRSWLHLLGTGKKRYRKWWNSGIPVVVSSRLNCVSTSKQQRMVLITQTSADLISWRFSSILEKPLPTKKLVNSKMCTLLITSRSKNNTQHWMSRMIRTFSPILRV